MSHCHSEKVDDKNVCLFSMQLFTITGGGHLISMRKYSYISAPITICVCVI